jgi:tetratricopeptide (TPR) repeat protein
MAASAPSGAGPLTPAERCSYELGRRRFERGDVEGALPQLERLLETRGGFADVHYMVGAIHERSDELEAARASLREALRINPSYTEALLALAGVCERQGDFDRSRELTEQACESSGISNGLDRTTQGKLANLEAQLADALYEAGELAPAIEAYRGALSRCPQFHDIRYRLAIALREAGRPDRALGELRRVLRGNPRFLDAAVQLGLTLYTLGRTPEALAQWKEVLAGDPERRDAAMYLRLVRPTAP